MKNYFCLLAVSLLIISCNTDKEKNSTETEKKQEKEEMDYPTVGEIKKLDSSLELFFDSATNIQVLAEGFNWSEGPVWIENGNYLLFSDVPEDKIYKWKEGENVSVYLSSSGYTGEGTYSQEQGSNGLTVDEDGNLLLCQHGNRQIARMKTSLDNPSSEFETVAGSYEGKKFNSPNDLAIYKDGSIYFTDPPYGLPGHDNSDVRELDVFGVYRVDTAGNVSLLVDNLTKPNGIAFSPDFSTCYVNVSDPQNPVIMAYPVNSDGSFAEGEVLFNTASLMQTGPGLPDGLKIHPSGYLFSTGPGGVLVISPEGKHTGTIKTLQATANCAFNSDFSYLYMTADGYLMRVPVKTK